MILPTFIFFVSSYLDQVYSGKFQNGLMCSHVIFRGRVISEQSKCVKLKLNFEYIIIYFISVYFWCK
jgi:hypothetical protein